MDRGAWQAIVHGVTKSWTRQRTNTVTHSQVSPGTIVITCSCAFPQSELVECIMVGQWSIFYHLRSRAVVRRCTVGGESDEVNNVTKTGDSLE